jgi:hypothetical protein
MTAVTGPRRYRLLPSVMGCLDLTLVIGPMG